MAEILISGFLAAYKFWRAVIRTADEQGQPIDPELGELAKGILHAIAHGVVRLNFPTLPGIRKNAKRSTIAGWTMPDSG